MEVSKVADKIEEWKKMLYKIHLKQIEGIEEIGLPKYAEIQYINGMIDRITRQYKLLDKIIEDASR